MSAERLGSVICTSSNMNETELKFEVPPAAAAAIESSLRSLGAGRASIESRYFDTAQGHLAAAGMSLRLRKVGNRWEQTVKAPGEHAVDRLEETVARPGRFGAPGPIVDPALHHGTRAGAGLEALVDKCAAEGGLLAEVYRSVVVRRAVEIYTRDARVEVAFDRGRLVAGDLELPICEVEYELKAGEAIALLEFCRPAIDAHGAWLSTLSKAARGDALVARGGSFVACKAQAPRLRRDMGFAVLRRAVLGACLDQALANASVLAGGQQDDEVIHQLRVGLRRLRTATRELRTGKQAAAWEAVVADVFRCLGDYRDGVTVAAVLGAELAEAGAPEPVLRASAPARSPVDVVRRADFQHALLDVLRELVSTTAPAIDAPADDARAAVGRRLDALHAALKKGAKRFESLSEDDQHGVRKRLKRLRYLAELVGSLYGKRPVERYLEALRPAQDELGHYLDVVVGIRLARERAEAGDPQAWFNVGWLSAQRPRCVKRCGKALRKAADASPFWRHGRG